MTNEEIVIRIQAGEDVGNNMALLYGQVKTLFGRLPGSTGTAEKWKI